MAPSFLPRKQRKKSFSPPPLSHLSCSSFAGSLTSFSISTKRKMLESPWAWSRSPFYSCSSSREDSIQLCSCKCHLYADDSPNPICRLDSLLGEARPKLISPLAYLISTKQSLLCPQQSSSSSPDAKPVFPLSFPSQ